MIAFAARLLRFLGVLLLIRFVFRALASTLAKPAPATPVPGSMDLVRDPVCGTFLPRGRGLSALVAGQQQQFCSKDCLERALKLGRAS